MRAVVEVAVLFAFLTAMSVVVAGVASTLALGRAQVGALDADFAAMIRADYSADPAGKRLVPLDQQIIEIARQDEASLQQREHGLQAEGSGVRIVPVFSGPPEVGPQDSAPGQDSPQDSAPGQDLPQDSAPGQDSP